LGGQIPTLGVESGRQSLARLDGVAQSATQRLRVVVDAVAGCPPISVAASRAADRRRDGRPRR